MSSAVRVKVSGAQSLVRALEDLEVKVVFGLPGGCSLPAYDALRDSAKIRHVLVRHEQGAGHAAQGYAQASGKVGFCLATSGPGATNLVTALADAHRDSIPVVAITGQVPSTALGTDAFQEVDILGVTLPVTKHSFLVSDAGSIRQAILDAADIASSGRPGPVLVDVCKDALLAECDLPEEMPPALAGHLASRNATRPPQGVGEAVELITRARRPVLYVGGGVRHARAHAEMTNQELSTCVAEQIPIKVLVINNGSLGMVRQWQTLFYDERHSQTDLRTGRHDIDIVKLAESYGCTGIRCDRAKDVDSALRRAQSVRDRPVVVDVVVSPDEMVWPMVPPGTSNSDIKIARDMAPCWDEDATLGPAFSNGLDASRRQPGKARIPGPTPRGLHLVARRTDHTVLRIMSSLAQRKLCIDQMSIDDDTIPGFASITLGLTGSPMSAAHLSAHMASLVDVIEFAFLSQSELDSHMDKRPCGAKEAQ